MRDRLKQAREAGGPETVEHGGDLEMGFVNDDVLTMRNFQGQVAEIRGSIDTIAGNTKDLEQLYKDNLNEPQESIKKQRTARIEKLMNESNKTAIATRKKLQEMEKTTKELAEKEGESSTEVRMRTGQHSALSKRFMDVMGVYQEVQSNSKKELRNRQKRELKIVSSSATDEEIEAAVDNISGPIFAQQIEMASQKEEAKRMLEEIQSRHEDIIKLEESLKELRQLFIDMQTLVEAQGEMLNEIEHNVDQAVDYTGKGVQEMKQAVKYQRKARKKMMILLCCVICLALVIVAIVVGIVKGVNT